MKIPTRVALATAVTLGAIVPASANHSWNGYHWAGDGTNLSIKVNKAITSQWTTSVGNSISDWDASNELTLSSQTAAVDPRKCNPISGQVLVCNYTYGKRGWLGIATIWLQSGTLHITQATTKLNDSYHNNPPYNTAPWRALVACQEIGHDWGLDHQDETFNNVNLGTCMDYTNAPAGGVLNGFNYGPSNEHPNKHDYDELNIIYNHNDGYTTVKSAVATNFGVRAVGRPAPQSDAGAGDTMAEWGRAIHRDSKNRPDVFLAALPDGRKRVTHVFWALEATGREAQ
jgi:hypothetical protein